MSECNLCGEPHGLRRHVLGTGENRRSICYDCEDGSKLAELAELYQAR